MGSEGDLSPMEEGMVQMHEVYLAFRKGGFTRGEALTLIAKMGIEILSAAENETE